MTELIDALKCCKEKRCEECPLLKEVCDELRVDMLDIPEGLVDLIVEALSHNI